jgi:uncharacterized membrane protein (UPF0182 family)
MPPAPAASDPAVTETGTDPAPSPSPITPAVSGQIQAALAAYEAGQAALQAGDWQAYGEAQAELEQILTDLEEQF